MPTYIEQGIVARITPKKIHARTVFSVSACNTVVTPVTLRYIKGQTGVSGQSAAKIINFIIQPLIWLQGCPNEIENTVLDRFRRCFEPVQSHEDGV